MGGRSLGLRSLKLFPPPIASPDGGDVARPPWGMPEIAATVLLTIAVLGVVSLVMGLVLRVLGVSSTNAENDPVGAAVLAVGQILIDVGAVALAAYFSLKKYRLSPRAWGLRRRTPFDLPRCAAVLALSFGTLIGYQAVISVLGLDNLAPQQQNIQDLLKQRAALPVTLVFIVAIAPTLEEMFFRGFLFHGFRRHLSMTGAAWVSGVLFGAIHVNGIDYIGLVIPFSIIGFLFAHMVGRTGSLWNAILVHACFNIFGVAAGLGGPAGVLVGVVVIVALFLVARALARALAPPGRQLEDSSP